MEKQPFTIDIFPPGTRFWIMHNNMPREMIVRTFTISQYSSNDPTVEYVIDFYNDKITGGMGSYHGNSPLKDPLHDTREKLIASLF